MIKQEDFRKQLNWDECIECGECLARCRYIDISKDEAIIEMKKINNNEPSFVIDKCMSCYACNAFCKENAHPYEKIHFHWNERYLKKGLPARASYLMPTRRPNFRQDISYSQEEKILHEKWRADTPPSKTILYPGCNLLAMPLLATGSIFDELPVWGEWDICCGEMYYRMGILDAAKSRADLLTEYFKDKEIDEMVFICPAGYNMFKNVHPKLFGASFNFKVTYFTDWFNRQLDNGTFKIKNKIKESVVMHDSCHARVIGDDFMISQRKLLQRIGMTVHETEQSMKDGLCCGVAMARRKYSIIDLVKHGLRAISALNRSKGDATAMYCTGCYLTLSCMNVINPGGKKIHHILEFIRRSLGEEVDTGIKKRRISMLAKIGVNSLPKYLSPKRFRL